MNRSAFVRSLARADLFVDAMFGTGFRGELTGDAQWIATRPASPVAQRSQSTSRPVSTAQPAPSPATPYVADATVCFAALKPGLLFEPGRSHAGRVSVADIGIAIEPVVIGTPELAVPELKDLRLPRREASTHKWSTGLLVFGGSTGMTGAPLMSARAAGRAGAGMVVCALPGTAAAAGASGSEIVMRALPATPEGAMDEDAARTVLKDITRFRALAIGPGLGRDDRAQAAVRRLIAEAPIPIVVDADALTALAIEPSALRVRRAAGLAPAILTPHDGEYERLAGREVGDDRVAAARDLARRTDSRRAAERSGDSDRDAIRRCLCEPYGHRCARDRRNG